jgi:hypothetical protein
MVASKSKSEVEKLVLDSEGDYFLLLPVFDRMPVSKDINC